MLLSRGVHGVALTDGALRALPDLERVLEHLQRVLRIEAGHGRALTVAGPSYLIQLFLPPLAEQSPHLSLCGLELPPAMLRAQAAENIFDASLVVGRAQLPSTWQSTVVGELRRVLLARPQLASALGDPPVELERVREHAFITPVYSMNGQFVQADDDCPLRPSERLLGHRVQTIAVALELATRVDQLVFGPLVAARRYLGDGALVEMPVRGWQSSDPLWLAFNPERLLAHEHAAWIAALQRRLAELESTS